ncbi:MAG: hypothetical protein RL211_560 [Pseudomonadota bacterium]|jgi:hypothetical protein
MKKFLLRRIGVASNETIARPSLADCMEIVLTQADALIGDVLEGLTVSITRSGTSRSAHDMSPGCKLAIQQLNADAGAVRNTFEAELRQAVFHGGSQDSVEPTLVRFADIQLLDTREIDESIEFALAQQEVFLAVDDVLPPFSALVSGLLGWITVQAHLNPLKPDVFVRALHRSLMLHVPDDAVRSVLLTPAAGLLGVSLRQLYREASDWLRSQGVEPADPLGARPAGDSAGLRVKPVENTVTRTLLTLDKLRRLLSGELEMGPSNANMKDFMHTVPASFVALQDLKLIEPMMKRLAQRSAQTASKETGVSPRKATPAQGVGEHTQSKQLGIQLGKEVVRMMLDHLMLDQRLLPKVRKQLRLVEPVLMRLSKSDPRFFSERQHPARQFLERMTHRSLGYLTESDEGFVKFLKSVSDAVEMLTKGTGDAASFSQVLQELDESWANDEMVQRHRQEAAARALLHAEQRNLLAQRHAGEFKARFFDQTLPDFVTEFLFGPWSQVVAESQLGCVNATTDSQGYLTLVDDLVWSVRYRLTRRNPARLVRLVPQLLGQIRQGLQLIDFPQERVSAFFDELITLHETAFESHRTAVAADHGESQEVDLDIEFAPIPKNVVDQVEGDEGAVSCLPESAAFWVADDESGGADYQGAEAATAMDFSEKPKNQVLGAVNTWPLAALGLGSWVELLLNDTWVRARLTWCSPHRTLFMFISGAGLAHSMSRRTMERLGAQNRIRVVSRGDLIDNALDAVAQTALQNELGVAHQTRQPEK